MVDKKWQEFIEKARIDYEKIGSISCPAFGGELVYFNKHGWNHLQRKGKRFREIFERQIRIQFLRYAPQIISGASYITQMRQIIRGNSRVYFWAIEQKINYRVIRLVVRQSNNGRKHFFSIMQKGVQHTKSPR